MVIALDWHSSTHFCPTEYVEPTVQGVTQVKKIPGALFFFIVPCCLLHLFLSHLSFRIHSDVIGTSRHNQRQKAVFLQHFFPLYFVACLSKDLDVDKTLQMFLIRSFINNHNITFAYFQFFFLKAGGPFKGTVLHLVTFRLFMQFHFDATQDNYIFQLFSDITFNLKAQWC